MNSTGYRPEPAEVGITQNKPVVKCNKLWNNKQAIQAIKDAILKSWYRAAALANCELLSLNFGIGKFISENSRNHFWGTNANETISVKLQVELPGLRRFSPLSIKRMRQFYEEFEKYIQSAVIRPSVPDEIQTIGIILCKSQKKLLSLLFAIQASPWE